ncbi:MAG: GbsR/MarR family transcriptional regulator [Acidimicrobiales bacterium]
MVVPRPAGKQGRKPAPLSDEARSDLVEEMGLVWSELGSPRMQGRVLGYLMLSNAPYVSSAELAEALHASTGSISAATKVLVDEGFIKRVGIAGQRSFFFRAEEDVWGAFLATEARYLHRRQLFAEQALQALGPEDELPRTRFLNMRDYHEWLAEHRHEIHEEWARYKGRGRQGRA